jgi:hypothetical protein
MSTLIFQSKHSLSKKHMVFGGIFCAIGAATFSYLLPHSVSERFKQKSSAANNMYVREGISSSLTPHSGKFTLKESAGLRRNFFFGHGEFSDILRGMEIIAATANSFHERKKNKVYLENLKSGPAFEESLKYIPYLSAMQLGMNEVYTFPSTFLLFEQEDYSRAFDVASQAVLDSRIIGNATMLAAYTAHVFLREPKTAAHYYRILGHRPNMPSWILDLAKKLETGQDTFLTDPRVRNTLCNTVIRSFPRIAKEFMDKRTECLGIMKTLKK